LIPICSTSLRSSSYGSASQPFQSSKKMTLPSGKAKAAAP